VCFHLFALLSAARRAISHHSLTIRSPVLDEALLLSRRQATRYCWAAQFAHFQLGQFKNANFQV